jgi:hypothetical protein
MTLPESLKEDDLLPALRWTTNEVAGKGRSGNAHARRLAHAIMFKVWPIFERADLTDPFVDILDGLESAFADGYTDEQWQSIAEHLGESVHNGLT